MSFLVTWHIPSLRNSPPFYTAGRKLRREICEDDPKGRAEVCRAAGDATKEGCRLGGRKVTRERKRNGYIFCLRLETSLVGLIKQQTFGNDEKKLELSMRIRGEGKMDSLSVKVT